MNDMLILGSTDVTLAVAEAAQRIGVSIRAIVHAPETFKISYAPHGVKNFRSVDVGGWCKANGVEPIAFEGFSKTGGNLNELDATACLVAGWYHMVPGWFRTRFERGCIGFHASLLPELRGGAPLNWAILNALSRSGVSMFELGDGVDDGPVYAQEAFDIGPRTRVGELVVESRDACARLVEKNLAAILAGDLEPVAQVGVPTYGLQRAPEDGWIDWTKSADEVDRLVRAVSAPYPGGLCQLDGADIAVLGTELLDNAPRTAGAAGQIAIVPETDFPLVVCGAGCVAVTEARLKDGSDALPLLTKSGNKRFARSPA